MKKIIFCAFLIINQSSMFSVPDMYFCTAVDSKYVNIFLNFVGSLFKVNYDEVKEIAVFDLGLSEEDKNLINSIDKVQTYQLDMTHPDLLTVFNTRPVHLDPTLKPVPGWYAWKPVILKQALDMYPYVLLIDAGATIMQPLNDLFTHIIQNNYVCIDSDCTLEWMTTRYVRNKFNLDATEKKSWLKTFGMGANLLGIKRDPYLYDNFVMPLYELAKDLRNFEDDGTTPTGFGCGRHDQPLFTIIGRLAGMRINKKPHIPIVVDGNQKHISVVFRVHYGINESFTINQSRNNIPHVEYYKQFIRYKTKA